MANINKQHFLLAGSCAVVLSVFSRSSLGGRRQGIREVNEIGILRKVLFREKAPEYHSGAINKEKHLQGRCCDQWAQKCLGSRDMLNHASGTSEILEFLPNAQAALGNEAKSRSPFCKEKGNSLLPAVEQATQREPLVSAALFCIFSVERNS